MADTRQKLIVGAMETIRTHGIAGVSARTVAASAGVNQALVFTTLVALTTFSARRSSPPPEPGSSGTAALTSLEQLAVLVEVMEDLGPVTHRALRAKLRPPPPRAHLVDLGRSDVV